MSEVGYVDDGNTVTYSYNDRGQPLTIHDNAGTITYAYDSGWGRVTSVDGVLSGALDMLDSFTYNNYGLEKYYYPEETSPVQYSYDSYGRMTSIADHNG